MGDGGSCRPQGLRRSGLDRAEYRVLDFDASILRLLLSTVTIVLHLGSGWMHRTQILTSLPRSALSPTTTRLWTLIQTLRWTARMLNPSNAYLG